MIQHKNFKLWKFVLVENLHIYVSPTFPAALNKLQEIRHNIL